MEAETIALIVTSIITIASAISAGKSDSRGGAIVEMVMKVINLVALNVGKAKNESN